MPILFLFHIKFIPSFSSTRVLTPGSRTLTNYCNEQICTGFRHAHMYNYNFLNNRTFFLTIVGIDSPLRDSN